MNEIYLDEKKILKTLRLLRWKQNAYKYIGKFLPVFFYVGFFAAYFMEFTGERSQQFLAGFLLIVIFYIVIWRSVGKLLGKKAKEKYAVVYKQMIVKPVLDSMFMDVVFEPLRGFSTGEIMASGLTSWDWFSDYISEDLIAATYQGVAFRRAGFRIMRQQKNGESEQIASDEDGIMLEVAFCKNISGMVKIVKKKEKRIFFPPRKLVKMADADFNEKFNVYADDKDSAFDLLTPRLMGYIKKLYFKEGEIYISFDGEKLYFLQFGHAGIFKPPEKGFAVCDEVSKCKTELSGIAEMIEILQPNQVVEKENIIRKATDFVSEEPEVVQSKMYSKIKVSDNLPKLIVLGVCIVFFLPCFINLMILILSLFVTVLKCS